MKKITSLLLCLVLVLSAFTLTAAAEGTCMEAGVMAAEDGTVTVVVTAQKPAANAHLTVEFDPGCLTYVGCETPFAVHSVKAEEDKLTIGLANPSAMANEALELVDLRFEMTGGWDETSVLVTADRFGGQAVSETLTVTVRGTGYRFKDVPAGTWYFEAVDRMAAEGFIKGMSDTHFGPGLEMNRASFVTRLGRLDGVEETFAETRFADVEVESFYSGFVAWADANGIVEGMSGNLFAPGQNVNRTQMVTFLYRYAQYKGMDVSAGEPGEVLKDYIDGEAVCAIEWAAEPFAWAVENGVINGMDGTLNPAGTANRAQVAVMLYRFFFEQ